MTIKAEQLLDQIRGIERLLDAGRVPDARGALGGIRHLLMNARNDDADDGKPVVSMDDAKLTALISKIEVQERRLTGEAITGAPGWAQFEDRLTSWGWYDQQVDSAGNKYRWCGQDTEAGLLLPFQQDETAAIALAVRPLAPEEFGTKHLEVNVNGRPVALRLRGEPGNKVRYLIVEPQTVKKDSMVEISFFIKHAVNPASAGLASSDKRKLCFNLFQIMWLPKD